MDVPITIRHSKSNGERYYTKHSSSLCIKAVSAGNEQLNIDVWNEGGLGILARLKGLLMLEKHSVTDILMVQTFTIRF